LKVPTLVGSGAALVGLVVAAIAVSATAVAREILRTLMISSIDISALWPARIATRS
jgi:hypothetical protein